jgi:hypothetical protein
VHAKCELGRQAFAAPSRGAAGRAEADQKCMVLGGHRGRVSRVVDRGAAVGWVVTSASDCDEARHNKKVPASVKNRPHKTLRLFTNHEIVSLVMHVRQR